MLSPWQIQCEFAILAGRLKHSWLENQILNKSPDEVLALRKTVGWPALEREFPRRMEEVRALVDRFAAGFSPAQLVDRLDPFRNMEKTFRDQLKSALHKAFLRRYPVDEARQRFGRPIVELSAALDVFAKLWREEFGCEEELKRAWEMVRKGAGDLHQALSELPKGVVFP